MKLYVKEYHFIVAFETFIDKCKAEQVWGTNIREFDVLQLIYIEISPQGCVLGDRCSFGGKSQRPLLRREIEGSWNKCEGGFCSRLIIRYGAGIEFISNYERDAECKDNIILMLNSSSLTRRNPTLWNFTNFTRRVELRKFQGHTEFFYLSAFPGITSAFGDQKNLKKLLLCDLFSLRFPSRALHFRSIPSKDHGTFLTLEPYYFYLFR